MEHLIIDGIDFNEGEAERYWTFPKGYKKDARAETQEMILSNQYIGSRKMDGAYFRFVKTLTGEMYLQSRSRGVDGNYAQKIEWVPHLNDFFAQLPCGTCLIGEIYFPNNEGSNHVTTIMGCLKDKAIARQEKDKLHYYIFDVYAYNGISYMNTCIEDRVSVLDFLRDTFPHPYVHYATYYSGTQLWDNLGRILASGGEGVVITKKGTHPEFGKRTARKTLKVKKEIQDTIDCFFTGVGSAPTKEYTGKQIEDWPYWIDVRTEERLVGQHYKDYYNGASIMPVTKPYYYKWASSLEIGVYKGNKIVPIGFISGLSDEIKANFKSYAMRPIEITCMEIHDTEEHGLRHAKMLKFRDDITPQECTYEKIFGNEKEDLI